MSSSLRKKIAGVIPLSAYRLITKRDVLGLFYHVVSDEPLPHIQHLYRYKSARMFENDLMYLAENFNLVTYEQLAAHYSGGKRLKPKSLILTFDDGLSECYSVARPLLLKHGIPCVFFIPTDYIGNHKMFFRHKASLCIDRVISLEGSALSDVVRSVNDALGKQLGSGIDLEHWIESMTTRDHTALDYLCRLLEIDVQWYLESRRPYMSADEIKRLVADGFTIGAHSVSHRAFDSLSDLEVEEEVTASSKAIMSLSGQPQIPFAFPFSADGVARDALQGLRKRYEYVGLFFDTKDILVEQDFIINRIWADWPRGADQGKTNLPLLLVKPYRDDFVLKSRRWKISLS